MATRIDSSALLCQPSPLSAILRKLLAHRCSYGSTSASSSSASSSSRDALVSSLPCGTCSFVFPLLSMPVECVAAAPSASFSPSIARACSSSRAPAAACPALTFRSRCILNRRCASLSCEPGTSNRMTLSGLMSARTCRMEMRMQVRRVRIMGTRFGPSESSLRRSRGYSISIVVYVGLQIEGKGPRAGKVRTSRSYSLQSSAFLKRPSCNVHSPWASRTEPRLSARQFKYNKIQEATLTSQVQLPSLVHQTVQIPILSLFPSTQSRTGPSTLRISCSLARQSRCCL